MGGVVTQPTPHHSGNIARAKHRTRSHGDDLDAWVCSRTPDSRPFPAVTQAQIPCPYSTTGSRSPSMWAMPIARRYDTLFSRRCFNSNPQRNALAVAAAVAVSASSAAKFRPPCSWRIRPCTPRPSPSSTGGLRGACREQTGARQPDHMVH